MSLFLTQKKRIATALIVAVVVMMQMVIPIAAHAQLKPAVPTVTNEKPNLLQSSDTFKEFILDLAARVIVGTLLTALTNQIIGWIQGDDGSNVGFVSNLDESFRKETNLAGGEFINNLAGIDLCTANLRQYLNISLRTPGLQQRLGCTLSGIGANAESFFKDFAKGGWQTFLKIGLEPQNNPYGAYLIALDAKASAESSAGKRIELGFLAGQSFLGGRGAVRKCSVATVKVEDADADGNPITRNEQKTTCNTEYNTKTPGGLVAQTLSKTVNIGYDFAVVSDEIDEAISAVVNALLNKLVSSTFSLANNNTGETETGPGLFNEDLSALPFGAAQLSGSSLPKNADEMVTTADAGLATADAIISATSRTLFVTRRQIDEMMSSIEPLTPAQQTQIATLRQTEAQMEAKLTAVLAAKEKVLTAKIAALGIKRAFQQAVTAEEFTSATDGLQTAAANMRAAVQEIEDADALTSVATPPALTSDPKTNTTTEMRSITTQISSVTSLLRELQSEARRLTARASSTPERRQELEAKITEIDAEVVRLGDTRTKVSDALSRLERATTPADIAVALGAAITELTASQDELRRANTLMVTLIPLLKPQ